MTIDIKDNKLIRAIQKEFNELFPFLRIEFFRKGLPKKAITNATYRLPMRVNTGPDKTKDVIEKIEITPQMTVRELVTACREHFGIIAHVYRKLGNLWLKITVTINWTLEQQNTSAREISLL